MAKKAAATKKSATKKAAPKNEVVSSAGAFGEAISDALTGDETVPVTAANLTAGERRQAEMFAAAKEAAKTVEKTS